MSTDEERALGVPRFPYNAERLRDLIAKLRHPAVNEQGVHIGRFCQAEREEAARVLESLLPEDGADGSAR